MLSIQGRRLDDGVARRAIEGAAGRIRVVGELNRMFNRLTSNDSRIDDAFVSDLVANCIAAVGAEDRVRNETSIAPIDLPRRNFMLMALILNECVINALNTDLDSDGGTIAIASRHPHGR
jgi:two-component sensor histidine kinase